MGNKKRKRKEASLAGSTPSAPTDSLKQQKESLLDKFRDNLIAQVVALVVSILTVGSCTYLLFDYRADRLKSEREVLRFDTLTQEDKWANDISQTYRTGVTANKDQTQKIVDAVRYLSNNVRIEKLDDRFPNDTLEWVIHSISQVVEEEGHVSGYTFSSELYKNAQQDLVRMYDAEKRLYNEIEEAIINWQKESVDERRKRLASIENISKDEKFSLSQIEKRSLQIIEYIDLKKRENERLYNELKNQIRNTTRKSSLSLVVILAVLIIILGTVMTYIFPKLKVKDAKQ